MISGSSKTSSGASKTGVGVLFFLATASELVSSDFRLLFVGCDVREGCDTSRRTVLPLVPDAAGEGSLLGNREVLVTIDFDPEDCTWLPAREGGFDID
jgi:hypothetical protein